MTRNIKIIIALVGAVIIVVIVVWGLNANSTVYKNVNSIRPIKGNPQAEVVLTEYSDFQCPACKNAMQLVTAIAESYQDQIKIEFKHLPLVSIHANSFNAALAAECANDQGKFWEMHDKLFENQKNLKKDDLKLYANQIEGIDTTSFNTCLDSRAKADIVNGDIEEATSLGINATPTFLLNGKEVDNYTNLDNLISQALQ